jgi:hypothetical protein
MKSAATYFNKILNMTPQTRACKNVSLLKHPAGLLLEMEDQEVRYQYFVATMPTLAKSIEVPFTSVYGRKKISGYTLTDSEITISGDDGDIVSAYHLVENKNEAYKIYARMDIDMLADSLYGAAAFAKKGRHVYNQHTFITFMPKTISVYAGTDISVVRNRYEADVMAGKYVGIENSLIPKIKKWLNYANDPKNGGGDTVWISIFGNQMKLQVQNCTIVFPISSIPAYAVITQKFDNLLDYKYAREEYDLDWDEMRKAIKTKNDIIPMGDGEMLRTFIADFVNHYSLQGCDVYKINTKTNAMLFEGDFCRAVLTLKNKEEEAE